MDECAVSVILCVNKVPLLGLYAEVNEVLINGLIDI